MLNGGYRIFADYPGGVTPSANPFARNFLGGLSGAYRSPITVAFPRKPPHC